MDTTTKVPYRRMPAECADARDTDRSRQAHAVMSRLVTTTIASLRSSTWLMNKAKVRQRSLRT